LPDADEYKTRHPQASDVLLLIEIADTSLRYDREVKVPLYARHGIAEIWIIDVARQELVRYRDNRGDGYAERDVLGRDATVAPAALPQVRIALDRVLE
jgi:Uma2 family endonuclease